MKAVGLLALVVLLAGCAGPSKGPLPLPGLIVALGDSITVAVNSDGQGEFPQHSWAVGLATDDGVQSFVKQVRERRPDVLALNDARSGARIADLAEQARVAARQRPDLVLILIGANDACTPSIASMTTPEEFRARLRDAADALPADAAVYVLSIPDVTQLYTAMNGNETAHALWKAYAICPSALAEGATDADRALVRERVRAFNSVIQDEARTRGWSTDDGAVFAQAYDTTLVSEVDAFHPSLAGQARLAQVAWDAGPFAAR